jgi:phosphoribosylamine-glycine ligase
MAGEASPVPAANLDHILAFSTAEAVDLIVAGEESCLAKGLADRGRAAGIPVWGPLQTAAHAERIGEWFRANYRKAEALAKAKSTIGH